MSNSSEQQSLQLKQFVEDAETTRAAGECNANCSPALKGRERFEAGAFYFSGTPDTPDSVIAFEQLSPNDTLGVFFRVAVNDDQLSVFLPHATVGSVLHTGRNLVVSDLNWVPGEYISFRFEFDFTYRSVDHEYRQGFFLLNF
ncbi:hypothetical protein [Pseudomonas xanthosomatis]|uniref:hypothetical protein n=1 Tax=Pseudomonas xanthosomatis TaxID=2842356 RepID=UPI0035174937